MFNLKRCIFTILAQGLAVWWLSLPQLTVLSRSAIVVWSKFVVAFLCFHVAFFVPRFRESVGTLNLIRLPVRPSLRPSVPLSVCHKNFNLGHNFCTITGRALILGMCVLCEKNFHMVPCCDLDRDLWPTSRSNLLPSGGPQFSEFACFIFLWVDGLLS